MKNKIYPFENEPLAYGYAGLEPYIDAKTMLLHHDRHLQTYIDNLNEYISQRPELQTLTLTELITKYPDDTVLAHNAGGVFNHKFFFEGLRPGISEIIIGLSSRLLQTIQRDFESFENFVTEFSVAANSVFGSGYAWLCLNGECKLTVITTPNQQTPLTGEGSCCPLLTLDVWEHAYYLKHHNVRSDYVKNFWKVVDWMKVSAKLDECLSRNNCIG